MTELKTWIVAHLVGYTHVGENVGEKKNVGDKKTTWWDQSAVGEKKVQLARPKCSWWEKSSTGEKKVQLVRKKFSWWDKISPTYISITHNELNLSIHIIWTIKYGQYLMVNILSCLYSWLGLFTGSSDFFDFLAKHHSYKRTLPQKILDFNYHVVALKSAFFTKF